MKKIALVFLLILLLTVAASAQQKVDVAVKNVNDRRTTGAFAELSIALELPKVQSSDVAASRVFVKSAVDDSGRDLVNPDKAEPDFQMNQSNMFKREEPTPAQISVSLKNPDRKAKTVKEVTGEIELYMPGKDPNSIAEIAKFTTMAGKPLTHKALKANGVEVMLLTDAQIAAEKKKRAEAKKKEYEEMGYSGEDLENVLKSFLEGLLGTEESELLARIKDPNHRIQDIAYVDGAGEVKMVAAREEEGITLLSTWGGKPQADWKLRVSMKTPKNVTRYAFALSDVPLP